MASSRLPLTLIVATTPSGGIGRAGALPWPPLRKEMAYFARVTRRAPPQHVNAVLMGRRTWDSIPPRFRPLKGRLNVVISRNPHSLELEKPTEKDESVNSNEAGQPDEDDGTSAIAAKSLEDALEKLQNQKNQLHRVFVIGGAEIYRTALELPQSDRILRTRVDTDFECDVFFPAELQSGSHTWKKSSKEELDSWVSEEVPAGVQVEKGVEWEFEMWTRKD